MATKRTARMGRASATGPKKRPTDVNQLAHHLIALSTDQLEPEERRATPLEISRVMAELGRRGGRIGGKKRAQSLTAQKRKQIAAKAARARWDNAKPS